MSRCRQSAQQVVVEIQSVCISINRNIQLFITAAAADCHLFTLRRDIELQFNCRRWLRSDFEFSLDRFKAFGFAFERVIARRNILESEIARAVADGIAHFACDDAGQRELRLGDRRAICVFD